MGGKLKSFMSRAGSSTIPPRYDSISDSIKADECDKANLLNFFFTGQALVDGSQKNFPANNQRRCKAPGPYIIKSFLHEAASQMAGPLSQLFNCSLHCCKMPSAWKLSNVCIISKGGDFFQLQASVSFKYNGKGIRKNNSQACF